MRVVGRSSSVYRAAGSPSRRDAATSARDGRAPQMLRAARFPSFGSSAPALRNSIGRMPVLRAQ
jgi:hypothetical protein